MSRKVFAAILLPVLGALAAADVAGKQDEPLDDSTVVSLTRTICFGSCPEYALRIFGSGIWTDAPTVTSTLQYGGQSYTVEHYHGDEGAPKWLGEMEDEIDQVAGTARWLPTPATEQNGFRSLCEDPVAGMRDVSNRPRSPLSNLLFGGGQALAWTRPTRTTIPVMSPSCASVDTLRSCWPSSS